MAENPAYARKMRKIIVEKVGALCLEGVVIEIRISQIPRMSEQMLNVGVSSAVYLLNACEAGDPERMFPAFHSPEKIQPL